MNPDSIEGKVKNGIGKVEAEAGEVLGDPGLQFSGEARQLEGSAEDAVGKAKEVIGDTVKKARDVVTGATDHATDAYQTVRKSAENVAGTVDPFVKEQPYIAVALAAIVGVIVGALLAGGGAKVIYIKPSRT
jgi:ElaB/YqjD/DUF883 family membrane-anchored ribosome-binding protein